MPSLEKLQATNKLRLHKASKEEITNLFSIVERDLTDASIPGLTDVLPRPTMQFFSFLRWSLPALGIGWEARGIMKQLSQSWS